MNTEEKMKIMAAYLAGKTIQIKNSTGWADMTMEPEWNWGRNEYRIKPLPIVRPYKNKQEFINDMQKHGGCLVSKNGNVAVFPTTVTDCAAMWPINGRINIMSFDVLPYYYTWYDSSPCTISELSN